MSRYKKDRKVGVIEHRSGVKIDLMFDPNNNPNSELSLTFSAKVANEVFRAKSAEEVSQAVTKFLDSQADLDWVPVIEVRPVEPFNGRGMSYIGLGLDRYYLANTADPKVIRKLDWDDYDIKPGGFGFNSNYSVAMNRIVHSQEFHGWHGDVRASLPYHRERPGTIMRNTSDFYYLLYDEATWAALQQIVEGIDRMQVWLDGLLGTDKGRAKLVEVGAKMARLLTDGNGK